MGHSNIVLPSFTLALTSERVFVPGRSNVIQFEAPLEQNYPQPAVRQHLMSTIYEDEYEDEDAAVAPTAQGDSRSTSTVKNYEDSMVSIEISSTLESCRTYRVERKPTISQMFITFLQKFCILRR